MTLSAKIFGIFMWAGVLGAVATRSEASTLAPTQLRGIKGVNISVEVRGQIQATQAVQASIRSTVSEILARSSIGSTSTAGQWLEVIVLSDRICGGDSSTLGLLVSVRLREPIGLKRDPKMDVPGGGAIVWWRDGLFSCNESSCAAVAQQAVGDYVELFSDQVVSVNSR